MLKQLLNLEIPGFRSIPTYAKNCTREFSNNNYKYDSYGIYIDFGVLQKIAKVS